MFGHHRGDESVSFCRVVGGKLCFAEDDVHGRVGVSESGNGDLLLSVGCTLEVIARFR